MRMMERCDGNDVVGGKTIKMKMKIAMVVGVRKEVFSKAEIGTRGTLDGCTPFRVGSTTFRVTCFPAIEVYGVYHRRAPVIAPSVYLRTKI